MTNNENNGNALQDVKQLGLIAALSSLSYVFWVVGGMEMVERLQNVSMTGVDSRGLRKTAVDSRDELK